MNEKKVTMIRVIKDKSNPYVMLNKELLNDELLSWKAKGILAYLLSLPNDWQIYETEVLKHSNDGISSLRSGFKELIKRGYMNRIQKRNSKGHFIGYEYEVYEVLPDIRKPENGYSNNGKPNTTNNDLNNNNRTKEKYILLPGEECYLSFYLKTFKEYIGTEHMKVKESNYNQIVEAIEMLKLCNISLEEWQEAVTEHFNKLPKSNNGNILAFLKAFYRYFEIDV